MLFMYRVIHVFLLLFRNKLWSNCEHTNERLVKVTEMVLSGSCRASHADMVMKGH